MAAFEGPNINIDKRTTEQNLLTLKKYLTDMADVLNYTIESQQKQISELQDEMEALKG